MSAFPAQCRHARFDGNLLIAFTGDATLDLTVPPDGHATTAPTTLVANGTPLYTFGAGTCLVAPAGAIWCSLPSPGVFGVVMQGALDLASGTGTGSFYVGAPPSVYAEGGWTAVKMP